MVSPRLLTKYPLISDQVSQGELAVILRELERTLTQRVDGAVVEFGCYIGTTSLFIRRVLDHYGESGARAFHVYDSFEGLPPKASADQNAAGVDFKAGELLVSKKQFLHEFQRAKLVAPIAHKAWFDQLAPRDIPAPIAFAFLDGDFYESILTSLQLVWPKLADNATVLVHDYKRETLPGVERAVHQFLDNKPYTLHYEQNIAILKNS
ncbi:MAG TPA: TylF/MycF/NovP-related O-methyltransferase [Candidatus Saccharimonadales bacterium]|nr:TylF/MycF/NovP-related O-methyltransferase [Candidatus Saccharimonadales bacterium]